LNKIDGVCTKVVHFPSAK